MITPDTPIRAGPAVPSVIDVRRKFAIARLRATQDRIMRTLPEFERANDLPACEALSASWIECQIKIEEMENGCG